MRKHTPRPSWMKGTRMLNKDRGDYLWKCANEQVPRKCATCEFNFGQQCAGHAKRKDNGQDIYGMPMNEAMEMFPEGCTDYGISLESFREVAKRVG